MNITSSSLRELDRRIRLSKPYSDWRDRNTASRCVNCNTDKDLECHHTVDLYHVILGYWRSYGDIEATFNHVVQLHDQNMLEGITLCTSCHKKQHPLRSVVTTKPDVDTGDWTAMPRSLGLDLNHSRSESRQGSVGLVALQVILGLGWLILNGRLESRMATINKRSFARLLGKTPGTSFEKSLRAALESLQSADVVLGFAETGREIEIHVSPQYLQLLGKNPWFVPMTDIPAKSMCVLSLRLFLRTQSNRRNYSIGLWKLAGHLGMTVKNKTAALNAIRKASKEIGWVKMTEDDYLRFAIAPRKATPVRTLRSILDDSIDQSA